MKDRKYSTMGSRIRIGSLSREMEKIPSGFKAGGDGLVLQEKALFYGNKPVRILRFKTSKPGEEKKTRKSLCFLTSEIEN